ncbi:alpha/beta hydrolase [Neiella marina]|uniref:Alpha/beta hydrolase n=1 Tax=Neiella holothuriorum TaxID=2870530 RepID=A0ABS7EBB4_9GAMM|nr:alpha/beta hydrolase [Neiella holothuriorum]MBW8189627.1 alpha/beta hydrolase [Neiella holothuriorum]
MTWQPDMKEDGAGKGMQRKQASETSSVANSLAHERTAQPGWYRQMQVFKWAWQGLDPLLLQEVQARIAVSTNKRTHDDLIDTVIGYRPGNWNYEWSQEGALRMHDGKAALAAGERDAARKHFLQSCLFYTIAGYPHLRGDMLAEDAHVLANQAYQHAGTLMINPLQTVKVPYQGKELQCYLHLPKSDDPVPLVIMAGGGDSLQSDYFRVFRDYLGPLGIAVLGVDMPGVGYAEHWTLEQDTSALHLQVLQHIKSSPWVNSRKIAMVGMRAGGHAAVRAAYMAPESLAAVVAIGAPVHEAMVDKHLTSKVPQMLLDQWASRLGMDAAYPELMMATVANFSLRRQGLLGVRRTPVPMLALAHPDDDYGTMADASLIASSSERGELKQLKRPTFASSIDTAFATTAKWLTQQLL